VGTLLSAKKIALLAVCSNLKVNERDKRKHMCLFNIVTFVNIYRGIMVFNVTFNNISVILWWSVLLVEETSAQRKPLTCCKSLTKFIT
jgi:hypothetical protein